MQYRHRYDEEGKRYKQFVEQIRSAKEFLKSLDRQRLENIKKAFIALIDARKELSGVFSSTYSICHECKGRCCGSFCGHYSDAVYLALLNKKLPAAERHSDPCQIRPYSDSAPDDRIRYCPFLGVNGCILGEDKPYVCLRYICEKFPEGLMRDTAPARLRISKAEDDFDGALRLAGCTFI